MSRSCVDLLAFLLYVCPKGVHFVFLKLPSSYAKRCSPYASLQGFPLGFVFRAYPQRVPALCISKWGPQMAGNSLPPISVPSGQFAGHVP